jgi:putative transposase
MQRFVPAVLTNQDALTRASMAPASEFGHFGARRISALWQAAGWAGSGQVGHHAG